MNNMQRVENIEKTAIDLLDKVYNDKSIHEGIKSILSNLKNFCLDNDINILESYQERPGYPLELDFFNQIEYLRIETVIFRANVECDLEKYYPRSVACILTQLELIVKKSDQINFTEYYDLIKNVFNSKTAYILTHYSKCKRTRSNKFNFDMYRR